MMDDNTESHRAKNFTTEENEILASLVKKYGTIIECKKSDAVTNKKREDTWLIIEKEFNSNSKTVFRSAKTLGTKWKNIKKKSKENSAKARLNRTATGGGPPIKVPKIDNVESTVHELLGERITGMNSQYDNDNPYSSQQLPDWQREQLEEQAEDDVRQIGDVVLEMNDPTENVTVLSTIPVVVQRERGVIETPCITQEPQSVLPGSSKQIGSLPPEIHTSTPSVLWKGATTPLLKKPVSTPLRTGATTDASIPKTRKAIQDNISKWATGKAALNDVREKYAQEEHKLKMEQMKAEHAAKMRREDKVFELEVQERKLRMKIMIEAHSTEMKSKELDFNLRCSENSD